MLHRRTLNFTWRRAAGRCWEPGRPWEFRAGGGARGSAICRSRGEVEGKSSTTLQTSRDSCLDYSLLTKQRRDTALLWAELRGLRLAAPLWVHAVTPKKYFWWIPNGGKSQHRDIFLFSPVLAIFRRDWFSCATVFHLYLLIWSSFMAFCCRVLRNFATC